MECSERQNKAFQLEGTNGWNVCRNFRNSGEFCETSIGNLWFVIYDFSIEEHWFDELVIASRSGIESLKLFQPSIKIFTFFSSIFQLMSF